MIRGFIGLFIAILTVYWASVGGALAQSAPSSAQKRQAVLSGLKDFLNQIPLIRIPITSSPGNGHQSSNIGIIERLRQLGFRNEIEVVYGPNTAQKISLLVAGFDAGQTNGQDFPALKLRFRPFDPSQTYLGEKAILAISAGNDVVIRTHRLGVKVHLNLQPPRWRVSGSRNMIALDETMPSGEALVTSASLEHLALMGQVYELPDPKDFNAFVQEKHNHQPSLKAKIAGLSYLISQKDRMELLPVYGHEIRKGEQLLQLLGGLRQAIDLNRILFRKRIVIPIFNELKASYQADIYGAVHRSGLKIVFVDINDPELQKKFEALAPDEFLVILVGPVAKPVFEYFYSISTLPPVVEGVNSINLMQLIGRPFLTSTWRPNDQYHFLDTDQLANFSPDQMYAYKLATKAHDEMISVRPGQDAIAEFVLQSKLPASSVNELFKQFSVDPVEGIFQDKLLLGLLKTRQMIKTWERQYSVKIMPDGCEPFLIKP